MRFSTVFFPGFGCFRLLDHNAPKYPENFLRRVKGINELIVRPDFSYLPRKYLVLASKWIRYSTFRNLKYSNFRFQNDRIVSAYLFPISADRISPLDVLSNLPLSCPTRLRWLGCSPKNSIGPTEAASKLFLLFLTHFFCVSSFRLFSHT